MNQMIPQHVSVSAGELAAKSPPHSAPRLSEQTELDCGA